MFKDQIRSFLKRDLTRPQDDVTHYLGKIAIERFRGAGLSVDLMTEAEDTVQEFFLYLQTSWYPNHAASVANRTDEELGNWVVNVFHKFLTERIQRKRAEPPTAPMLEEPAESGVGKIIVPLDRQPRVQETQRAFERFFHDHESAAVEWAKREKTGKWWKVWRIVEQAIRANYSAEHVFEIVVRILALLDNPKAPRLPELTQAHFRAFLQLRDLLTVEEIAEVVGLESSADYHSKAEANWSGLKETAKAEIEIRSLIEQIDPDTTREVIERRFDNILREKVGFERLPDNEVSRRRSEQWDELADPKNPEDSLDADDTSQHQENKR